MRIKKGCSLQGLQILMRPVLIEAEKIWDDLGQELTVTAGTDGEHSAGSLHYYGYAIDLRTRYFTQEEKFQAYCSLAEALEHMGFDIYLHDTHIHVEYQDIIKDHNLEWRTAY